MLGIVVVVIAWAAAAAAAADASTPATAVRLAEAADMTPLPTHLPLFVNQYLTVINATRQSPLYLPQLLAETEVTSSLYKLTAGRSSPLPFIIFIIVCYFR